MKSQEHPKLRILPVLLRLSQAETSDHLVHEGAGRRRADLQHDRERVAVAATHIVSHAYRLCVRTGTQKTQAPPHCIGAA